MLEKGFYIKGGWGGGSPSEWKMSDLARWIFNRKHKNLLEYVAEVRHS